VWVKIDGVEDAEGLLPSLRTLARRAAQHLLIEDAAVHPPQENEVFDARNVNAGGQKIHRDGNPVRSRTTVIATSSFPPADSVWPGMLCEN